MAEAAEAVETAGLGDKHLPPDQIQAPAETQEDDPRELMRSVATEMGWSPKEKWKGDPEKWRDEVDFLKATPKVVKSAKEAAERTARVAAETIEKNNRRAIEDAEARIAAAAEAGDPEAAREATADLIRASAPVDPVGTAWTAKNPWFHDNKVARDIAVEAAEKAHRLGKSSAEQCEAAEAEVRKLLPGLFGEDTPEAKASKGPPAVEGGQRTASPAPRKKGWNDLPAHVRQAMPPKTLKMFNLSQDEYAQSYFKENP